MSNVSLDSRIPGKRTACDRCRMQKVRCSRIDGHPTGYCTRCARSGVECITSSTKRPGRPTGSSTKTSQQRTGPTPDTCNEVNTLPHTGDIPPLTDVDSWFNIDSLDVNYEISSVCWASVNSGDMYLHDVPIESGSSASALSSLPTLTNNPTSLNGPTETTTSEYSPSLDQQSKQGHNSMLQRSDYKVSEPNYDYGLRFSVLHRDLSKLLFTLRSTPKDMIEAMQLTCSHDESGDSAKVSQPNIESSHLARIVKISKEFAELLQSFQAPRTNNYNNDTQNTCPISPTQQRLGIPELLTALSCHILIVSIYDLIFCHFIEQALYSSGNVNVVVHSPTKIFLGGVAFSPWPNTLGHLLVCLTESQLRPIEMSMGLPDKFCVSKNSPGKDKHHGLFSGQSGQSLFRALVQIDTGEMAEAKQNLRVIESLKENIRRIKCLL